MPRSHRVNLNFENDIFSGKTESKFKGYHALQPKRKYDDNPKAYKEDKINSCPEILIENHDVIDFDKTKSNFNERIELSFKPEIIGNKIYLDPFIFKFFILPAFRQ